MIWGLAILAVFVAASAVVGAQTVRANRRRIDELEATLHELGEAERIVARANGRRDRSHLKLLGLVPLAWLARSSHVRMAAATAASAVVIGVGFTAPDPPHNPLPKLSQVPPAGAMEMEEVPVHPQLPADASASPTTTTSMTVSAAALPPAPAADVEPSSAPAAPSVAPSSSTTTTTTLLPVELPPVTLPPLPRQCLNPKVPLDVCLGG